MKLIQKFTGHCKTGQKNSGKINLPQFGRCRRDDRDMDAWSLKQGLFSQSECIPHHHLPIPHLF